MVFKRENNKWVFEQEFSSETFPEADIKMGDLAFFGKALLLGEDILLTGDYDHLYVFEFENDKWVFKQELYGDIFTKLKNRSRHTFYLGDKVLAVSHIGKVAGSVEESQLIYIFARDGDMWVLEQILDL